MIEKRIFRIIRVSKIILFLLFFLNVSSSGKESVRNLTMNQFRIGSVDVTLPISWTDQLRGQYSGRVLSDFCFHSNEKINHGVILEVFTWQKLWKSKELFVEDYERVEDIAKNNPQFLAAKNYKVGLIQGNYLIEIADSKDKEDNTSITLYIKNSSFTGSIVYCTNTKDGMNALIEFKKLLDKQTSIED